MRDWDIVVDSEAIPSEKYAAQEFQRFLSKPQAFFFQCIIRMSMLLTMPTLATAQR
jgi:hypothetical protein